MSKGYTLQLSLPPTPKGRRSQATNEARALFAKQIMQIRSRLDFSPSARGWCYTAEPYGLGKNEFDKLNITSPKIQLKIAPNTPTEFLDRALDMVRGSLSENRRDIPNFLTVIEDNVPEGCMSRFPEIDDVSIPVQTQLIVELCSR